VAPPQADRIAVLAIAYHNIGVEQEFLKRYEQSMLSYRKGVEVAERYLGGKHPICITLKNSLIAAKKTVATMAQKKSTTDKAASVKKGGKADSSKLPDIASASKSKKSSSSAASAAAAGEPDSGYDFSAPPPSGARPKGH
jgi:hypothetical protein